MTDSHHTWTYLRKESNDIYNRLHSIEEDIQFVRKVRSCYPSFPIFPNLRCGAWYTTPSQDTVPVYFKSTDGHVNNWSFNLRRSNLHLLTVLISSGGAILVDSTRSGKRMPDAFSKTVPIWCAVINRAVRVRYTCCGEWDGGLYTPPSVSGWERGEIERRIDGWVDSLVSSSFDIPELERPIRPLWITPSTRTYPEIEGVIPLICVSASKETEERRGGGYTYIQGSGDDHELWGMGLDPELFWRHREALLRADRNGLEGVVQRVVLGEGLGRRGIRVSEIGRVGGVVSIANGSTEEVMGMDKREDTVYILITSKGGVIEGSGRVLHFFVPEGKKGQHELVKEVFPKSVGFIGGHVSLVGRVPRICCGCDSKGWDRSVGVGLVLLSTYFDMDGHEDVPECAWTRQGTKERVRRRLEWIVASCPDANPTRTTLRRVNDYLM